MFRTFKASCVAHLFCSWLLSLLSYKALSYQGCLAKFKKLNMTLFLLVRTQLAKLVLLISWAWLDPYPTCRTVSGIAQVVAMTPVRLWRLEKSWRRARRKLRWLLPAPPARGTGARWVLGWNRADSLHASYNAIVDVNLHHFQMQIMYSSPREWPVLVELSNAPSSHPTTMAQYLASPSAPCGSSECRSVPTTGALN